MNKLTKEELENFYKNEGMVIYIKGKPMIMIYPDNLENNLKALNNGDLKFDWELMLSRANDEENNDGNGIVEYKNTFSKIDNVQKFAKELEEVMTENGVIEITPKSMDARIEINENGHLNIENINVKGNFDHEKIRIELAENDADYTID